MAKNAALRYHLLHLGKDDRVITSEIRDRDAIMKSIKDFLGTGR